MDSAPSGTGSTASAAATRGSAWKIVLSVVAVTAAMFFLFRSSMKEGVSQYRHVDEVMANPNALRGKRIQVHGNVVKDSIEQARGTLQFRFKIETGAMSRPAPRPAAVITALYTGIVPDTFKSGAEVVATGKLTPDNQLNVVQDGIMAKCPSKYEAKPGEGRLGEGKLGAAQL